MVAYAAIAIVQSVSVYRIRNFSKLLVANQVFFNERFMVVHLFAFIFLAICKITISSLQIAVDDSTLLLSDASP